MRLILERRDLEGDEPQVWDRIQQDFVESEGVPPGATPLLTLGFIDPMGDERVEIEFSWTPGEEDPETGDWRPQVHALLPDSGIALRREVEALPHFWEDLLGALLASKS